MVRVKVRDSTEQYTFHFWEKTDSQNTFYSKGTAGTKLFFSRSNLITARYYLPLFACTTIWTKQMGGKNVPGLQIVCFTKVMVAVFHQQHWTTIQNMRLFPEGRCQMTSVTLIVTLNVQNLLLTPSLPNTTIIQPSWFNLVCSQVIALIHPNFNPADSLSVMGRGGVLSCDQSEKRGHVCLWETPSSGVLRAERSPWGRCTSPVMLEVS